YINTVLTTRHEFGYAKIQLSRREVTNEDLMSIYLEFKLATLYASRKGESIKSICVKNKITKATFFNWRKH
ncbi:hypothetical protein HDU92_004292, partial [Lobulomyces angularis]